MRTNTPIHIERAIAPVPYPDAVARMEALAAGIHDGSARETVWLLEHPPLYTAGTSAKASDLVEPDRFPVFQSGRGGQYTYHGPGQRVAYTMLDLRERGRDLRCFVHEVEGVVIDAVASFGVRAERRPGRVGVWVAMPDGTEAKIGAIGIRVRRWVSFHGLSLNVAPDLGHFGGIVPCGIREHGVTSLRDLGVEAGMEEADAALMRAVERRFGPVEGP